MPKKTYQPKPKNKLPSPVNLPEIRSANEVQEIPPPALPKELVIGKRMRAKEILMPTDEYSGVGCA